MAGGDSTGGVGQFLSLSSMGRLFAEGIHIRYDFSEYVLGNQVIKVTMANSVMHFF